MKVKLQNVTTVFAAIRWGLLGVGAVFMVVFEWFWPATAVLLLCLGFGIALRFAGFRLWLAAKLTGEDLQLLRMAYDQRNAGGRVSPSAPPAPGPADPSRPWGGAQPPVRQVQSKEKLRGIVARERQDAILLKRHWPVGTPSEANSWLGGTPRLPKGISWPVHPETGLALHHLAQIDLGEMPALEGGPFPDTGMLWFFADIDEEMCWRPEPENGQTQVIYHPVSTRDLQMADVPDTLPELDHPHGQMVSQQWGFRGPSFRVYPRWPVTGHISGVWAFSDVPPEGVTDAQGYFAAQKEAWAQEREAVLGPAQKDDPVTLPVLDVRKEKRTAQNGKPYTHTETVYLPQAAGGHFPYTVRLGQAITAHFMHKVEADLPSYRQRVEAEKERNGTASPTTLSLFEGLDRADQQGGSLRAALAALDPEADFPAHLQPDFDALMSALAAQDFGAIHWNNVVNAALSRVVAQGVSQPERLAKIPQSIVDSTTRVTHPSHVYTNHYLGGAKGAATNPTPGEGIRLAQFDSDGGLGMMFCDVGIVDFWISPEDLAAGRWDRAWGATAGG